MRFRSKPTEIEAIRWTGGNFAEIKEFVADTPSPGRAPYCVAADDKLFLYCKASDADVTIEPGGWVIREQDGSGFYPCRDLDFRTRWEPAGYFDAYSVGLAHASVCTDLTDEAVTERLDATCPTGITTPWAIKDDTFADGTPNPSPCEQDPTRRHILFAC